MSPTWPKLLDEQNEQSRLRIASRVGERLTLSDLPAAERLAAEALARALVADAIELVRRALSLAVRHAEHLPRDIALKIAHDVDSVACPFLEVTEVFSDSDWHQLVLTISRGARIAVARRSSMSEGLALALAQAGDSVVAETLVDNPAAPMTPAVCLSLADRFGETTWILDKLAERGPLDARVALSLYPKVSAAIRTKLASRHGLVDYTDPVVVDAEQSALLALIRKAPESQSAAIAEDLRRNGLLGHGFLLKALREGLLGFFEAAMAVASGGRMETVRSTIRHGGSGPVIQLLREARVPGSMHDAFWDALQAARGGDRPPGDDTQA